MHICYSNFGKIVNVLFWYSYDLRAQPFLLRKLFWHFLSLNFLPFSKIKFDILKRIKVILNDWWRSVRYSFHVPNFLFYFKFFLCQTQFFINLQHGNAFAVNSVVNFCWQFDFATVYQKLCSRRYFINVFVRKVVW